MSNTRLIDLLPDIVENLAQGVVVQDQDGRIVLCNGAAERILGLTRDQMSGRDSMDPRWRAIHEDGSAYPGAEHPAMLTLADGQPRMGAIMGVYQPDGALTWIEIDSTPIRSTDEAKPDWVISSFSDVSARHALEADLRASEMRFQQLANNIDLVFWVGTPDWRHVDYISPAYARIWQRDPGELMKNGMDWFDAVLIDDRAPILAAIPGHETRHWRTVNFPPYRIVRADGNIRWIAARAFPIRDQRGEITHVAGIAEDITARHEQQRQLEELAHLDPLTRLPNRALLGDRMNQSMARCRRTGEMMAICMLDLDGFKPVNDQYGHKVGDELLVQLAGRLNQAMRADDTVARLGGDEFVLLLSGLLSSLEAEDALIRLRRVINQPFQLGEHIARVSASIGVTLYPSDTGDADTLLRHADHAMYLAKEGGKNRYVFFNPALEIRDRENRDALQRIESALTQGQFVLYYQPIVDCQHGRPSGVEALLRWQHPILGVLTPEEFLPLIEGHDRLALEVGTWAIETAVAQAESWHKQGIDLSIGVNVFPQQFRDGEFHTRLSETLSRHPDLASDRITLEIVESSALEDIVTTLRLMRHGADMGVHYALDDFGTGYSSMTYLRRLPVRVLKIDKSFVRDMLHDPEDMAIVEAIIGLASAFRHQVIAEGVETLDQILMLTELGCHMIQGYALARPMPAGDVPAWIRDFTPDPRWLDNTGRHLSRDDFQLILAEVHHRHWLKQIQAWVKDNPVDRTPPAGMDLRECEFGHWYATDGQERYGHLTEFHAANIPHERVHQLGREVVEMHLAKQFDRRQMAEARLIEASEQFIETLLQLRRAVSHPDAGR
jgi:diguanylate cyclase (GGDEF)-like protein/PAS domain S-box-containing protein